MKLQSENLSQGFEDVSIDRLRMRQQKVVNIFLSAVWGCHELLQKLFQSSFAVYDFAVVADLRVFDGEADRCVEQNWVGQVVVELYVSQGAYLFEPGLLSEACEQLHMVIYISVGRIGHCSQPWLHLSNCGALMHLNTQAFPDEFNQGRRCLLLVDDYFYPLLPVLIQWELLCEETLHNLLLSVIVPWRRTGQYLVSTFRVSYMTKPKDQISFLRSVID